ncbi:hypothetical protein GCM10009610_23410 [Pseudonocardia xinjiangensis]
MGAAGQGTSAPIAWRGTAHVRHPCSLTTVATRARERWISRVKSISGNVVPLRRDTVERVHPASRKRRSAVSGDGRRTYPDVHGGVDRGRWQHR